MIRLVKYYRVQDVLANPDDIYVFGDNLIQKGYAGQAVIRVCPNTIGVPTKRTPSMRENAFFSDKRDEFIAVVKSLNLIRDALIEGKTIVLPSDGIGTGMGRMEEKSPILYNKMKNYLQQLCPEYMKE